MLINRCSASFLEQFLYWVAICRAAMRMNIGVGRNKGELVAPKITRWLEKTFGGDYSESPRNKPFSNEGSGVLITPHLFWRTLNGI
jgi:hypothetical protein